MEPKKNIKKKEQVYLVLGNSEEAVHEKILKNDNLKRQGLNYIHDSGKIKDELKAIMIKFRQNVKKNFVKRILRWLIGIHLLC